MKFTPELRAEYLRLWDSMLYLPGRAQDALHVAKRLSLNLDRYKALEARLNIPAAFIMVVHERESSGRFNTYLGNGQLLSRETTIVPKHRGPFESFEEGAYDALVLVQGMGRVPRNEWDEAGLCWYLEKMNGFGYRSRGLRSPYLWGGTNHQQPGKYMSDGPEGWDPTHWDEQLGGMAVYGQIVTLYPDLAIGRKGVVPPGPLPLPPSTPPKHEAPPPAQPPTTGFWGWLFSLFKPRS